MKSEEVSVGVTYAACDTKSLPAMPDPKEYWRPVYKATVLEKGLYKAPAYNGLRAQHQLLLVRIEPLKAGRHPFRFGSRRARDPEDTDLRVIEARYLHRPWCDYEEACRREKARSENVLAEKEAALVKSDRIVALLTEIQDGEEWPSPRATALRYYPAAAIDEYSVERRAFMAREDAWAGLSFKPSTYDALIRVLERARRSAP